VRSQMGTPREDRLTNIAKIGDSLFCSPVHLRHRHFVEDLNIIKIINVEDKLEYLKKQHDLA